MSVGVFMFIIILCAVLGLPDKIGECFRRPEREKAYEEKKPDDSGEVVVIEVVENHPPKSK